MEKTLRLLIVLMLVVIVSLFPACSLSSLTPKNSSDAVIGTISRTSDLNGRQVENRSLNDSNSPTVVAEGQLPTASAKVDRINQLGPQSLDGRGSQVLSSLRSLPADASDGRLLEPLVQTRWWRINRWNSPTQMFGQFVAVENTFQGLASPDWVAAIPLNVAYGTTTDFVWFQFGIRFDSGQVTPVMDLQNNIWRTGMQTMQYNHNYITDPSYVANHIYSFSLAVTGSNTATFVLIDTTTASSWFRDFTVPSTNLLVDPVVAPTGGVAFSPASAAEGITSNPTLTNVPFFQFQVANNINSYVYRQPVQPPGGISTDQIRIGLSDLWYWEMLAPSSLPIPSIGSVSYPSNAEVGQAAIINVPVTNNGGPSAWQSIAVSFPVGQTVNALSIVQTDLGNTRIHNAGETVHSSYSLSSKVLEQYLIEGTLYWETGASHYLKISIAPALSGTFVFYVKSVAAAATWACNWDPNSGDVDQQGEFVKTYTINVGVSSSSISVSVDPAQIVLGGGTSISGAISSSVPGDLSGTVYLEYSVDSTTWHSIGTTTSTSLGSYSYWWTPSSIGTFLIHSYWNGNSHYGQATSSSVGLTVSSGSGSLRDHAMCKGVGPDPYDPITRTNTFYTDDSAAYSWIDIVGPIYGAHQIHWDWFDPDGWNWCEDGYNIPDPGPGYYYPWYRSWDPMSINGYQSWYATRLGRPFQTKVYYDGILILTETWQVIKHDSSISISLSQTSIAYGQSVTISSQTSPLFSDGTTTFQYSTDGTNWNSISSGTPSSGYYSTVWVPPTATTYQIRATWSGNLNYYSSTSVIKTLAVNRANTLLTTTLSEMQTTYGGSIDITAAISPPISGKMVTIQFSLDGSLWYLLSSGTTDSAGQYKYTWTPNAGTYQLRSTWSGDANYQGTTSASQQLIVLWRIQISADGSVNPLVAPISSIDQITYTLTNDISGQIIIEKNNTILDGAHHAVSGATESSIRVSGNYPYDNSIENITIKNVNVEGDGYGIYLFGCYNVTIQGNEFFENNVGIMLEMCSYIQIVGNEMHNCNEAGISAGWGVHCNRISGNRIMTCGEGMTFYNANCDEISGNTVIGHSVGIELGVEANCGRISQNVIEMSGDGIYLGYMSHATICENNITSNNRGISLESLYSSGKVYHNNFEYNTQHVFLGSGAWAEWDDGYPSGGNYWSDYFGADSFNGPHQNESGSDGIGDTPYSIAPDNIDRYPLIIPWETYEGQTVYIRTDGTINPRSAPISTFDCVTYTLTESIVSSCDGIIVQKNDITINGNGYTLQGPEDLSSYGIRLIGRTNVAIQNVQIKGFHYGISLDSSSNIMISGNNITANSYAGIMLVSSSNNVITENNVISNTMPGYASVGIYLYSSDTFNTISNNNASLNYVGILLWYGSNNNTLVNNVASYNEGAGIDLGFSDYNVIASNNASSNKIGIRIERACHSNTICSNCISSNIAPSWSGLGWGVYIDGPEVSTNNKLYHNNIVGNTHQAYSSGDNTWDDGYPSGGNYWSDYVGTDINRDGIGDTSYTLDSNNRDNYPLMNPWPARIVQITFEANSQTYTATLEGNTTITSPVVNTNSLTFTTLGDSGTVGYVNITFPAVLSPTEFEVFIDDVRIAPEFLTITSNGTNYFLYFEFGQSSHTVIVKYAIVDLAVTNVSLSKTIIGQNSTVLISITLQNQGSYEETFNVTIRVNSTIIDEIMDVALSNSNSTTIVKPWNSTDFGYGNYTVSTCIEPVSGETNIGNNNRTSDSFHIGILGDINGDSIVDIFDAILLSKAYNSVPTSSNWNPNTDLKDDGIVDLFDAIILSNHYGEHE